MGDPMVSREHAAHSLRWNPLQVRAAFEVGHGHRPQRPTRRYKAKVKKLRDLVGDAFNFDD